MLELSSVAEAVRDCAPSATEAPGRGLRVLFASYRAHPHVGGQGVYAFEITRALSDLGCRVDVIAGPPYPDCDPRVRLIKLPSLDLFAKDNAFAAFRPAMLSRWPDLAEWALHNTGAFGEPYAFGRRLSRWLKTRADRYDVVHDNQGLYRPLAQWAKRADGPAPLATLHHPITIDLKLALECAERRLDRLVLRRWHGFVATQAKVARALPAILTVSQASKSALVRDFGVDASKIHVSPNGVDHEAFRPRPDHDIDPDLLVATASSDLPLKGLPTLIAAFAKVAAERPATRLTVIGRLRDGPVADALQRSGVAEQVTFKSGLDREALATLYASAALVVSPSLFEGFGFPAAEAMACGAAVVATNGGALPEVVGDAGVITPAGDADALAAAVLGLIDDEPRRKSLGAAARARALTQFSWRAHASASLDLYRQLSARC